MAAAAAAEAEDDEEEVADEDEAAAELLELLLPLPRGRGSDGESGDSVGERLTEATMAAIKEKATLGGGSERERRAKGTALGRQVQ